MPKNNKDLFLFRAVAKLLYEDGTLHCAKCITLVGKVKFFLFFSNSAFNI